MKRSGTVQPPAPPRQQPPPPHTAGTTAPTGERGIPHNVPSAGGTTPHQITAAGARRKPPTPARRRAGAPRRWRRGRRRIQLRGRGGASAGAQAATAYLRTEGGSRPRHLLSTCDNHRCPERRYILCPGFWTPTTYGRGKKRERSRSPAPRFSSFPRIPNLTPFGVVVRNVFHAGKLEVVFHGLNLLLDVREFVMGRVLIQKQYRAMGGGVAPPA